VTGIVASITTTTPGADQTLVTVPRELLFDSDYLEAMALALRTQGTFFIGESCRTVEQSKKVAKDVLILLDIMLYAPPQPKEDGPLAPGYVPPNPATGVVPGTPGYFTPEGCDNPSDLNELNYRLGNLGQSTPWPEKNWVEIGLPDFPQQVTWIGPADQTANYVSWVLGPLDRSKVRINDNFPPEPTITDSDQANADKLQPLGFYADGAGAWASWDSFWVGKWAFYWDGSQWRPVAA
jgi:hypothetical protein